MYRVMLADDEPIMRKALLTLTDWGDLNCEIVYVAANGQEVLDNLESMNPDILITDIKMPGKDGIEIARHIWENKLTVKVIILTAYADFSYAQSAVKYNVVDYLTKTGLFDSLAASVEQAKEDYQRDFSKQAAGRNLAGENFFKAVFDGSLYDEDEIRNTASSLSYELNSYTVLLLRFRMEEEPDSARRKIINKSLSNFYTMVFMEQLLQSVALDKDLFALILTGTGDCFREAIEESCIKIIDMMDNFMKLYVHIGISGYSRDVLGLKQAYQHAMQALEASFIDESSKINFYVPESGAKPNEPYFQGQDKMIESICHSIMKGNKEEALNQYEQFLNRQKELGCSADAIKNTGILLQNRCRKLLSEYDKTLYEIMGRNESISKLIYASRYIFDFYKIMEEIIAKTADFIMAAVDKKKSLIYDCQKYIDQNYEKSIMVSKIAEEIGASASYLSRIFKEATGQTIIHTINMKKLEKAKEYLCNKDMKIYEIAEALGFENTTYFSHFFKKYMGISPKEYLST